MPLLKNILSSVKRNSAAIHQEWELLKAEKIVLIFVGVMINEAIMICL